MGAERSDGFVQIPLRGVHKVVAFHVGLARREQSNLPRHQVLELASVASSMLQADVLGLHERGQDVLAVGVDEPWKNRYCAPRFSVLMMLSSSPDLLLLGGSTIAAAVVRRFIPRRRPHRRPLLRHRRTPPTLPRRP